MAEFGPQATQVAAPQEAGVNPVAPVTQEISPPNWGQALGTLVQEVGGIAGTIVKGQQTKTDQAFLQNLAQQQALVNQGVSQGSIGTKEATTRVFDAYNHAIAARPDLADKIGSLYGVFQKTTVAGDIEQERKDANALKTTQLNQAISQGYFISADATEQQKNAIITASQSGVKLQRELTQIRQQNEEARSQGNYDRSVAEAESKTRTVQLSAQYAGDNLNAFNAQITDISRRVRTGDLKDNPQAAQQELARVYATYSGGLDAIGGQNPALVNGWKDLFKEMYATGQKALDPKFESEQLTNELNIQLTKGKLQALAADPRVAGVVATSQLLGQNATVALQGAAVAPVIINAMAGVTSNSVVNGQSQGGYRNPVVGNPDTEKPVLDMLQSSIKSINSGGFTDPVKAKIEASNGINNVLMETGKALNNGAKPEDLKGLVSFFASPEYASWVKNGKIDPIAQQTAAKTFQIVYQPAVTKKIGDRLNQELIPASEDGLQTSVSMAQGLDVKMQGDVLTFVPRAGLNLTPDQQRLEAGAVKNLQEVQQALNTMVHLGAHMEGSTDYAKHWEANKYYYLPQIYPVKPGQVVGNAKWSGNGDWRDRSTWSRVGQR